MFISIDAEKHWIKFENPFMIKSLNKVGTKVTYPKIETINHKLTFNVLNNEKMEAFHLRSGRRQRCPLLPLPFNKVLEALVTTIRQINTYIKDTQTGTEEVNSHHLLMTSYYM